ncbi:hypothetical protein [Nocardia cyriacigeorgica]|nr:hypothetical protein [Nocardia cyriacigeorgica]
MQTAPRIDVPRERADRPAGPIVVAGVARAQRSGRHSRTGIVR